MAVHHPSFESVEYFGQEDFFQFVQDRERTGDLNHYELLNGRIVMNPPAGFPHGRVESAIHVNLANFVKRVQFGDVLGSSQGYALPSGDTVEPDVSVVSKATWEAAPQPVPGKFLCVVPDLVVEILSASTAPRDRGEKKAIYERNGVKEYWLVSPATQEIRLFTLSEGRYDLGTVFGSDDTLRSKVLTGFEVEIREIFG